jgi:hypothetical protein
MATVPRRAFYAFAATGEQVQLDAFAAASAGD